MTELEIWISVVKEKYPKRSRGQYWDMKNTAAIYYYFGDDDINWNPKNELQGKSEYIKLFEQFLIVKSLKQPNNQE